MRLLRLVPAFLFAVLAFLMQVGPDDAISNLYKWLELITTPPQWMRSPRVDAWGWRISASLAIGSIAWFFWPHVAKVVRRHHVEWQWGHFLAGGVYSSAGIRIGGFQAAGINRTGRTLTNIRGYVESLLTGETFDLYLVDERGLLVRPDETHGIPNQANFKIYVPFIEIDDTARNAGDSSKHLSLNDFLSRLNEFLFVFRYDGKQYVRRFGRKEIEKIIDEWKTLLIGPVEPRVISRQKKPPSS